MATVEHSDATLAAAGDEGVRRRDFINIAAVSFAGVGGLVTLYPLVNQMNPSADVLALASIEVDISQIQPGQSIKTIFRKQPLFVRHLAPQEIQAMVLTTTRQLGSAKDRRPSISKCRTMSSSPIPSSKSARWQNELSLG